MNFRDPDCRRVRVPSWGLVAGAVAAFGLLGSSAAMAQNCAPLTLSGSLGSVPGTIGAVASGLAGANAIAGAVTAANTAFLTQSTAFVSAPGNPKPDSEGAGIWVRGVGGDLTLKSNTQVAGSLIAPAGNAAGTTSCNSQYHQTFAGFQLGQDIAKLNFGSGWNLHLGTTAGYLETKGDIVGGNIQGGAFNSATQAPFLGSYAVLTKGSFYVDGLVRADYFQTNLNSPTANIFDQKVDAHGVTAAFSTGYNYKTTELELVHRTQHRVGLVERDGRSRQCGFAACRCGRILRAWKLFGYDAGQRYPVRNRTRWRSGWDDD